MVVCNMHLPWTATILMVLVWQHKIQAQDGLCSDGQVRLANGPAPHLGRVEVCINETYGTVCETGFGTPEASVVCGQLGYSRIQAVVLPGGIYSPGSGPIYLTSLMCVGNESTILDCPFPGIIGLTGCIHSQDANVVCSPVPSSPQTVTAIALSNTTINVSWAVPLEFYSTLIRYTVTCNTSSSARIVQTDGPSEYNAVVTGLFPFTSYNCCVIARYNDTGEDAAACSVVSTLEGVPVESPLELSASINASQCSQVGLTWDPPLPDARNGIISGYLVEIMASDDSGFATSFTTADTNTSTMLSCCTNFSFTVTAGTSAGYGPRALPYSFRTPPDKTLLPVSVQPFNATNIVVTWNVSSNISSGPEFASLSIRVSPECSSSYFFGRATQHFDTTDAAVTMAKFSNLVPFVKYRVVVSAVICQDTAVLHDGTHTSTSPSDNLAPVVVNVTRSSASTVYIKFSVPPGGRRADRFIVRYFTSTGPDNRDTDIRAFARGSLWVVTPGTVTFHTLQTCNTYWAVAISEFCYVQIKSEAVPIPLQETSTFEAVIDFPPGINCSSLSDDSFYLGQFGTAIVSVLNGDVCEMRSVSCVSGSSLSCDNSTQATYNVTLVSTLETTSDQQLSCLTEWSSTQQTIVVTGQQFQIVNATPPFSEPTTAATTPSPGTTRAATTSSTGMITSSGATSNTGTTTATDTTGSPETTNTGTTAATGQTTAAGSSASDQTMTTQAPGSGSANANVGLWIGVVIGVIVICLIAIVVVIVVAVLIVKKVKQKHSADYIVTPLVGIDDTQEDEEEEDI